MRFLTRHITNFKELVSFLFSTSIFEFFIELLDWPYDGFVLVEDCSQVTKMALGEIHAVKEVGR